MAERRPWLPSAIMIGCVAVQLAVVAAFSGTAAAGGARSLLLASLGGLTIVAVAASLWGSMQLGREGLGVRLLILVPIALSVALVAVLMLDTGFRVRAETATVQGQTEGQGQGL